MINNVMQKLNKKKNGKGGFTVVELCITLALVALLTTMAVSFSVLMNKFTDESKSKYEFLKDSATIEREFTSWVETQEELTLVDSSLSSVSFANETLSLGDKTVKNLDTVSSVSFETNRDITLKGDITLIKCTVLDKNGRFSRTFVVYLRTTKIDITGGTANE